MGEWPGKLSAPAVPGRDPDPRGPITYGRTRNNVRNCLHLSLRSGAASQSFISCESLSNRLTLKSNSSGTITSVKYHLGKAFDKIRDFSIFPIQSLNRLRSVIFIREKPYRYETVIFFNVYVFQRIAARASRWYRHILWQTAKWRLTDGNRPVTRSTSQYKSICEQRADNYILEDE